MLFPFSASFNKWGEARAGRKGRKGVDDPQLKLPEGYPSSSMSPAAGFLDQAGRWVLRWVRPVIPIWDRMGKDPYPFDFHSFSTAIRARSIIHMGIAK